MLLLSVPIDDVHGNPCRLKTFSRSSSRLVVRPVVVHVDAVDESKIVWEDSCSIIDSTSTDDDDDDDLVERFILPLCLRLVKCWVVNACISNVIRGAITRFNSNSSSSSSSDTHALAATTTV